MEKAEIKEMLIKMKEGDVLTFERITVKKILNFVEGNHGLAKLDYSFYNWFVEFGEEDDKDYDYLHYGCQNEEELNTCVKTILKGKICY